MALANRPLFAYQSPCCKGSFTYSAVSTAVFALESANYAKNKLHKEQTTQRTNYAKNNLYKEQTIQRTQTTQSFWDDCNRAITNYPPPSYNPGRPPAGAAIFTARKTASAIASAANAPTVVTSMLRAPVESAKITSPSSMV